MAQTRSPQMTGLMGRYGVTTQAALLRAVRDEWTRETGERYTIRDAELMLDGMLEAEYQRLEGAGAHLTAELTGGSVPAHVPGAYPRLSCCGGPVGLVPA